MGEFGDTLREERERKGYSLADIEDSTKIRKMYLQALEDENFSVLPAKVYACGFVKNYAGVLELDAAEMVNRFKALAYPDDAGEETVSPPPRPVSSLPQKFDFKRILIALAFLVLAVWLGQGLINYFANDPLLEQPPAPPVHQPEPVTPVEPQPPVEPEPPAPLDYIKLDWQATEDCWVSIQADGETVVQRVLRAGESGTIEAKESIDGRIGNAGGLTLTLNHEPLPPLGASGAVTSIQYRWDEASGLPTALPSATSAE